MAAGTLNRVTGTPGNDSLTGTDGADLIHGLPGDDLIHGLAGDDRIFGGSGGDTVFGGDGNDIITDRASRDDEGSVVDKGMNELHGGAGNDRITAVNDGAFVWDSPSFRLFGDAGNDTLIADYCPAEAHGGDGNDRIILSGYAGRPGTGAYGDAGDDMLLAAPARLLANPLVDWDKYSPGGQQVLDGGAGNDRIYCYAYTEDTVVMAPGGGRDTLRHFNVNPDSEHYGPVDHIDFTAFDLDMSVDEFIQTRIVDRGDFVILNPGDDSKLVIWGVDPEQLAASLML